MNSGLLPSGNGRRKSNADGIVSAMHDFALCLEFCCLDDKPKPGGKRSWHELQTCTGGRQVTHHTGDRGAAWTVDPGMQEGLPAAELTSLRSVRKTFHSGAPGNFRMTRPWITPQPLSLSYLARTNFMD
jgi:hypothetical protein